MKLLIFGKNGQVAQSLRDALMCREYINGTFLSRDDFTIDEQVICDLIKENQPSFIVNCAAYTDVEGAEDNYDAAYQTNALLPKYLGIASQKFNIPVIHFSTDYVFDGTKEGAYVTSDQKNPLSVYGKTKSLGEDFLLAETSRAWILRTSWVYSVYGKNFFKTMCDLLQTKETLNIISDQFGAPTAAHELAHVIVSIIETPENYPYGLHHVAGEGETSWLGLACAIQKLLLNENINSITVLSGILTQKYPTKAKRPLNSRLYSDIFQLKNWEESLQEVFKKYTKEIKI